jgi:LAO/AO transport system kinase
VTQRVELSAQELVSRARNGEPRAVARLISWVEDGSPALPEVMALLADSAGTAHVVGLTGAPGVGKSTTTSALVSALRHRDVRVGVIAVDPTSPFSGGALLGDRIRMQEHATDPGVFIRSMASRGHLGGLAATTPQAVRILEAAGCSVVLVETVGVGQSEVEVAAAADTTVVLLAPGMGDGIQAAKAGILEVGDVFCVNKADRDGADATAREVRHMLSLAERTPTDWKPPVVASIASRGEVGDLLTAIDEHRQWLTESGAGDRGRKRRAAEEVTAIALARIRERLTQATAITLENLAGQVVTGEKDPYTAAAELLVVLEGRGDGFPDGVGE